MKYISAMRNRNLYWKKTEYTLLMGVNFPINTADSHFSTHWLHFIPKDLVVYQGLLSLPLIVDLSDEKNGQFHRMFDTERLQSLNFTSYQEYTLELLKSTDIHTIKRYCAIRKNIH